MTQDYQALQAKLRALTQDVPYPVSCLANAAALLYHSLPDLNWAGFYLMADGALWLGPFQGPPACLRIPLGQGVCGASFAQNRTLIIPDVHQFPGHIACDAASNSELVIPLHFQGRPMGVMDLDSPRFSRFSPEDQTGLEGFCRTLEECCPFLNTPPLSLK